MNGSGVFIAEGDEWKRQRRLVVTALNTHYIRRYFDVVRVSTERLRRRLQEAARDGRSLEIADELTSYTVDITSALALDHDLNTLERRDNELQGHLQRIFLMTAHRLARPDPLLAPLPPPCRSRPGPLAAGGGSGDRRIHRAGKSADGG